MNYGKLQYFVSVAEHLSFSKAAESLYLSQPSLSRQIANLESEIGFRLFARTKRSVSLTPEGEVFLIEAKEIMRLSENLMQKVDQLKNGVTDELKIGYWEIVDYNFMVETFRGILKRIPGLRINPIRDNFGSLLHNLRNGRLDLVYTANIKLDNIPDVLWMKLASSKLQVAMSKDHPLANKKNIRIDEIAQDSIIKLSRSQSPLSADYILHLFTKNGISPRIVQEPLDLESVLLLVGAGVGTAILSSRLQQKVAIKNVCFADIDDPDAYMSDDLVWHKENANPIIKLFVETAKHIKVKHCTTNETDKDTVHTEMQSLFMRSR